jgi:hypothetical protein
MLRILSLIILSFIAILPAKADVFCFNPVAYDFKSNDNVKYAEKEKACLEAASKFAERQGSILRLSFGKEFRPYYLVNNPFACQKEDSDACAMYYLTAFYSKTGLLVTEVSGQYNKSYDLYDSRDGEIYSLRGFPFISPDENALFVPSECSGEDNIASDFEIYSIDKDKLKLVSEKKYSGTCFELDKFESPTKIKVSYYKMNMKSNDKPVKKTTYINKTPKGWVLDK